MGRGSTTRILISALLVILGSILVLFLIASPFLFYFPTLNDKEAERLATETLNAPAPEQTEVIEVAWGVGNTSGSSNFTVIWIGLLIKSDLPKEELLDYYSGLYERVNVYEVTADEYPRYYIPLKLTDGLKSLEFISDYHGYYIVGRTEPPVTTLDFRGH